METVLSSITWFVVSYIVVVASILIILKLATKLATNTTHDRLDIIVTFTPVVNFFVLGILLLVVSINMIEKIGNYACKVSGINTAIDKIVHWVNK